MVTVTMASRTARPFTQDDLEQLPDDGYRYELIDGTLIVTPAPTPRHQTAVLELAVILRLSCPDHLQVFVAPLDVALNEDTVMEPDVLVARRSDLGPRNLRAAPLLAVEVVSPFTRRIDLTLKRDRLEAAGCTSYWVIDPDRPAVLAWELRGGRYLQVADLAGDEEFAPELPYPLRFRPSDLLR